jgi:hypothetical protein
MHSILILVPKYSGSVVFSSMIWPAEEGEQLYLREREHTHNNNIMPHLWWCGERKTGLRGAHSQLDLLCAIDLHAPQP